MSTKGILFSNKYTIQDSFHSLPDTEHDIVIPLVTQDVTYQSFVDNQDQIINQNLDWRRTVFINNIILSCMLNIALAILIIFFTFSEDWYTLYSRVQMKAIVQNQTIDIVQNRTINIGLM